MKKTTGKCGLNRRILVSIRILAFGIAIVSTVRDIDNPGQNRGPGYIPSQQHDSRSISSQHYSSNPILGWNPGPGPVTQHYGPGSDHNMDHGISNKNKGIVIASIMDPRGAPLQTLACI